MTIKRLAMTAYAIGEALNRATGNAATAYFTEDDAYIVVDNITGDVVQISNRNIPDWVADSNIKNIRRVKYNGQ